MILGRVETPSREAESGPRRDALAELLPRPVDSGATQWRYGLVIVGVAVTSGGIALVSDRLSVLNALLIYLLLCVVLALLTGSGPAVLAAAVAFLAFNFFVVPPVHTLRVASGEDLLALVAFLVVAVVTGQLVARVRTRTEAAVREQRRTALLFELNSALISDVTLDAILATIVEQVVRIYGAATSRILLPNDAGILEVYAAYPQSTPRDLDRQLAAVASWAIEHGQVAGRGRGGSRVVMPHGSKPGAGLMTKSETDALFLPIQTTERRIGVLEVAGRPGGGRFRSEDEGLLTSFANQAALAIERTRLTRVAAGSQALAESDAFKTTLLAALSHDLRTPLAVIRASATALLDRSVTWDGETRTELLQAIDDEADRLNRLVGNLLDLTRLEGSVLRPDREWYDIAELVADVTHRPGLRLDLHSLTVELEPDLPLVYIDYVQIAQVLANLLENAVKHTASGTAIAVSAFRTPAAVEITVSDDGPGIPASYIPRLFDAFYRAPADRRLPGAGIGLAICKGFVEAHGGRIAVDSAVGFGTSFRFTLPVDREDGTSDGR